MSDTWNMECRECEGSGRKHTKTESLGIESACPTCHRSGRIELEVKCGCTNALRGSNCDDFHGSDHYRPMTESEVAELARLPKLDLIAGRIDVMYDNQGAPVRLKGG